MSDAPNPGGTPPAGGAGAAPPAGFDFTTAIGTLTPEHQSLVNDRKWDGLDKVLDSYRNLEKLTGVPPDKIMRVPEKPEDYEAIYNKLGRPEKPDLYGLDKPPEGFDPAKYDVEGAKAIAEVFHKVGLNPQQARALQEAGIARAAEAEKAAAVARQNAIADATKTLKSEWGDKFEANLDASEAALDWLGASPELRGKLKATGLNADVEMVKLLAKIGHAVADDKLEGSGEKSFGAMTPALAKAKINSLKNDAAWRARFTSGDVVAREEWSKLNAIAAEIAA